MNYDSRELEIIVFNNAEFQTAPYVEGKTPRNLVLDIPDHRDSFWDSPATTKYHLRESNVIIKWCRPRYLGHPYHTIAFSNKYQVNLEKVEGEYSSQNIAGKVLVLINKYKYMSENQVMERCIISLKNEIGIKNEEARLLKEKIEELEKRIDDKERETAQLDEALKTTSKELE